MDIDMVLGKTKLQSKNNPLSGFWLFSFFLVNYFLILLEPSKNIIE